MTQQSFGAIGLAVMGENLALNVESKGFPVAICNRSLDYFDSYRSVNLLQNLT
jgi:6-phosphogluconate dehydrogenase